ncbi:unnamed protein product [Larinioides sclopetarius]|uniref:Uncharacterized protein n=1 Tax=Larinioides sclopetarius TaxID=280406 RepID=A0AAV2AWN2_9ARAC
MICCSRYYMDSSVNDTINRTSNFFGELRSSMWKRRISKFVGCVGDWGVGKDSLVLKMLGMDIPVPKLEQDHPYVRRKSTSDIPDLKSNQHFDLTVRIIPGKYCNRARDENFFDYLRPGDYDFDALVFCFDLNSTTSFINLEGKWIPKAKVALGNTMPYFMVIGTKNDLPVVAINDYQEDCLKANIDHVHYSRCSVHNNVNIEPIRNMLLFLLSYKR